ncbi:helix-turn-helix transcriptional regulator [Deinococcus yunweiensis]|uniref:helix-turn-helix transcriptional regulator n=1 Tax=Deinococcus yunweiensis TaxID=367282 RepID=UPI00398F012E
MAAKSVGRPATPALYNRLPVLRAERGLSRQDLAAAVDVNYQTIGYLERGEYAPSLDLALLRVPPSPRRPPGSSAC